jgi:hypothetical protein
MDGERLFSDKEVKALLSRAVDISRGTEGAAARDGIGLTELRRIAAEAGLPAEALGRAIAEAESGRGRPSSRLRRFFGGEARRVRIELREAPSEAALSRLLLVLPDLAKWSGGSGAVADGVLVWRGDKSIELQNGLSLRIEVGPSPGGTGGYAEIGISADGALGGIYGGLCGGLGLGAGLGVGLGVGLGELHSTAFAIFVPIACLGLSFLLSRGIVGLLSSWARRKIQLLSEELSRRLGGA